MSNYFTSRDIKNLELISNYLKILPELCFEYFMNKEANTSSNTRLGWAIDLNIFFEFIGKYKFNCSSRDIDIEKIKQISTKDIVSFLSYLSYYEHNGQIFQNSNTGKARKLASIRSFFKWLFNNNYIISDVASRVETPKHHDKAIMRLEIDEVAKMLNTSDNPLTSMSTHQGKYLQNNTSIRDTAILTLFLSTGIRVSELVGLNVNDFDFDNNAFKITRKGGNQTILYFGNETKESLQTWLKNRSLQILPEDEQAMFTSLQKRRITVRAVQYLVKKYAHCVNPLKKISPHKLRSTFGTNLYRNTHDIYMVADVLGHKDINTTQKHYAAVAEDSRRIAASVTKLRDKKNNN